MLDIQEVFDRMQQTKKSIKEIKDFLKSQYELDPSYVDTRDKVKALNANKRSIVSAINSGFPEDITKLEDLKIDLATDKELLNDIAMSMMMKGDTVEVSTPSEQQMLPIFQVSFKKQ